VRKFEGKIRKEKRKKERICSWLSTSTNKKEKKKNPEGNPSPNDMGRK
jgi:hypothetical protein